VRIVRVDLLMNGKPELPSALLFGVLNKRGMGVQLDYVGKTFGLWRVLRRTENEKDGHSCWLCECECGRTELRTSGQLRKRSHLPCRLCIKEKSKRNLNLVGQTFGELFVTELLSNTPRGLPYKWKCLCACGNEHVVTTNHLIDGHTMSCGCKIGFQFIDRAGEKHGKFTVVKRVENSKKGRVLYLCKCDCGREKVIDISHLRYTGDAPCICTPRIISRGKDHHAWKGGFSYKDIGGYVQIYNPNHAVNEKPYVAEHILIMSNYMGRKLTKDETVHHKNGIRDDNRIENLELWASHHPSGQRVTDLISYSKEILLKYEPTALANNKKGRHARQEEESHLPQYELFETNGD
jgi:hypothetical protein